MSLRIMNILWLKIDFKAINFPLNKWHSPCLPHENINKRRKQVNCQTGEVCVWSVNGWQSVGEMILCGRHICNISLCMWLFSFCSQWANRISLVFISPFIFLTLYGCLLWSPITIAVSNLMYTTHIFLSKQFQVIRCVNSSFAHCLCYDYAVNSATKCACALVLLSISLVHYLSVFVAFVSSNERKCFILVSYHAQTSCESRTLCLYLCLVSLSSRLSSLSWLPVDVVVFIANHSIHCALSLVPNMN